jgi:hypothetical protein
MVSSGHLNVTDQQKRERNRAKARIWRNRRRDDGLVTITVTVSPAMAADMKAVEHDSRCNPHLTMGPMVDRVSGRYVSIRRPV